MFLDKNLRSSILKSILTLFLLNKFTTRQKNLSSLNPCTSNYVIFISLNLYLFPMVCVPQWKTCCIPACSNRHRFSFSTFCLTNLIVILIILLHTQDLSVLLANTAVVCTLNILSWCIHILCVSFNAFITQLTVFFNYLTTISLLFLIHTGYYCLLIRQHTLILYTLRSVHK